MTDDDYTRPDGVSDEVVEATGKLTEALEWIERARGDLFEFHQKIGHGDAMVAEAAEMLEKAGRKDLADKIMTELSGMNVLRGRWSFQIVDDFDDGYYKTAKSVEKAVRDELLDGKKHIYESELKEKIRTHGQPGHESRPGDGSQ